ncbi:MAG: hypothetical protein ACI4RG_10155 [Huintestinicola sp.]
MEEKYSEEGLNVEEKARSKSLNNTDLIKILIDRNETLIRENERLKAELEKLKK